MDFSHTNSDEAEKRIGLLHQIFGSCGENTWMEPPLTVASGKTVSRQQNVYQFKSDTC